MGSALVARLWGRRDRDVRGRPDGGVASLLWVRASIARAFEGLARPATRGRTRRASTRCPCSGTRDAPTSVSRRPRQPRARAGSPGRVRERPRSRGAGGPAPRRAPAQVGPALCVEVRRSRRARRLPDGTRVALGDRIGVFHVNNARIAAVHVNGQPPLATGLEFRRWFVASLHELAQLAADGGPLADVRAFSAITIFHRGLSRLGFRAERNGIVWPGLTAAYQRALMASLHPAGPFRVWRATHARARRLWMTRAELLSRYT